MSDRFHGSLIVYPKFSVEIQIHKLQNGDETFYRPKVIIEHKRPYAMWDYATNGLVFTTQDEYWLQYDFTTLDKAQNFVGKLAKAVNLSAIS